MGAYEGIWCPLQQAPDSESEEDLEWKVLSIVGTKGKEPRRSF